MGRLGFAGIVWKFDFAPLNRAPDLGQHDRAIKAEPGDIHLPTGQKVAQDLGDGRRNVVGGSRASFNVDRLRTLAQTFTTYRLAPSPI